MGDQFYVPPLQSLKECRYLERNYIFCLLQKGMKDRISSNQCNLESVLWFHLECPDWVKKFDDPIDKSYLKRQIFNLLLMPYINTRILQSKTKNQPIDQTNFNKRFENISYSEELKDMKPYAPTKIRNDKRLQEKFFEGIELDNPDRFVKVEAEAAEDDD